MSAAATPVPGEMRIGPHSVDQLFAQYQVVGEQRVARRAEKSER